MSCEYPFLGASCDTTFASYVWESYKVLQDCFLASGAVAFLLTNVQCLRVMQLNGSLVQRKVYALAILASSSFIVRGIDPFGYAGVLPKLVQTLASDVCSACLYSVSYICICLWLKIILQSRLQVDRIQYICILEWTLHIVTWFTFAGCSLAAWVYRDMLYETLHRVKFFICISLLWACASAALVYGLRVHLKLKEAVRLREERVSRQSSTLYRVESGTEQAQAQAHSHEDTSPTARIRQTSRIIKVLVAFEFLTLLILSFQIYELVAQRYSAFSDYDMWKDCLENERNCERLHIPFPFLNILQYVGIWLTMWVFYRIKNTSPPKPVVSISNTRASI